MEALSASHAMAITARLTSHHLSQGVYYTKCKGYNAREACQAPLLIC